LLQRRRWRRPQAHSSNPPPPIAASTPIKIAPTRLSGLPATLLTSSANPRASIASPCTATISAAKGKVDERVRVCTRRAYRWRDGRPRRRYGEGQPGVRHGRFGTAEWVPGTDDARTAAPGSTPPARQTTNGDAPAAIRPAGVERPMPGRCAAAGVIAARPVHHGTETRQGAIFTVTGRRLLQRARSRW